MAKEIERKFLVTDRSFKTAASRHVEITQFYISRKKEATVRVRLVDNHCRLTIKGPNNGAIRDEWEYEIPVNDGKQMTQLAEGFPIVKTRWIVPFDGLTWEVDEFHGKLEGLIVAEVELPSTDTKFNLPPFVGQEVTEDPKYYNSNLSNLSSKSFLSSLED